MLSPIGKPILVTDPKVISRLRKSVEEGTRLDTSNSNWTPKKSIQELKNWKQHRKAQFK